ncbi:MAG: hypothetical protein ACT4RN_07630 [Pseudonocardia sp.]
MQLTYCPETKLAWAALVDRVEDGEIERDIGPQLTPTRDSIIMSYDGVGNLLGIEMFDATRILRPELLAGGRLRLTYDPTEDTARLYFTDERLDESKIMEVGPQLTPTGDALVLGYDQSDYLVYLDVFGGSRVLREDTLAQADRP